MGSSPASRSAATTLGKCAGSIARMSRPTDALAARVQPLLDRARHLVAGRELVHEALAGGVVERRALAADRLGHEEPLAARHADDGGGVELQELEVRQARAGARGRAAGRRPASPAGWSCAPTAPPRRRWRRTTARARRSRGRRRTTTPRQRPSARHSALRAGALEHRDRAAPRRRAPTAGGRRAGRWRCPRRARRAGPSGRPRGRARARRSGRRRSARRAPAGRARARAPRARGSPPPSAAPAPRPASSVSREVQLEAVVGRERRGEAALRPVARGLRERRRRDEHHARPPGGQRRALRRGPRRPRPPLRRRSPAGPPSASGASR